MRSALPLTYSTAINLQRLIVLRWIVLGGQVLAVWVALTFLRISLPWQALIVIIAVVALINFLTWWRTRRSWPVLELELFAQLIFDGVALTALLYFSGGATNPFVILYLLPLALTAAALSTVYAWSMVAATVACYTSLMFFYVPLLHGENSHDDNFGLHVFGMWLGFVVSAALIAWFAVHMAETRRSRDRLLAQMREDELRNDRLVALGTLAAGAAHELGTPLSTMAVLAKEMERDTAVSQPMYKHLRVMRDQIDRCKSILSTISASAGQSRAEGGKRLALEIYLEKVIQDWRAMRVGVHVQYRFQGERPAPEILAEQTLSQAITSILNNAADASLDNVEVNARWDEQELVLDICDRGAGLTPDALRDAGQPFFTTKASDQGLGLGLFLAHATLQRFGGTIHLYNRDGGGVCTQVMLPLAGLRVDDSE